MKNAPKGQKKTSPVVWVALIGGAVAVYMLTGGEPATSTAAKSTKKIKKSVEKDANGLLPIDYEAKFASFTSSPKDAFTPLVKKTERELGPPPGTVVGIPRNLTGGEDNWYYSGIVELDGRKIALLENTVTGESTYVGAGEPWKAARVEAVDISTVVLVGPDGTRVNIPIVQLGQQPGVAEKPMVEPGMGRPTGSNTPLAVPGGILAGQIGNPNGLAVQPMTGAPVTATLSNGQQVQIQMGQTNNNNNNGNSGRGGRRNRGANNSGGNNVP